VGLSTLVRTVAIGVARLAVLLEWKDLRNSTSVTALQSFRLMSEYVGLLFAALRTKTGKRYKEQGERNKKIHEKTVHKKICSTNQTRHLLLVPIKFTI